MPWARLGLADFCSGKFLPTSVFTLTKKKEETYIGKEIIEESQHLSSYQHEKQEQRGVRKSQVYLVPTKGKSEISRQIYLARCSAKPCQGWQVKKAAWCLRRKSDFSACGCFHSCHCSWKLPEISVSKGQPHSDPVLGAGSQRPESSGSRQFCAVTLVLPQVSCLLTRL